MSCSVSLSGPIYKHTSGPHSALSIMSSCLHGSRLWEIHTVQYRTGQDSTAGRNYCFHFFLTDSFLLYVKTPGLKLLRSKSKSFFYGFCLTSRLRFKKIQLKDAYTKKKILRLKAGNKKRLTFLAS